MSNFDVIRAWKDEEYRNSLTEEQKAQLPENPAGLVDLTEEEINEVGGGWWRRPQWGRALTITAECGCPFTLTGRCRCPF